MRSTHDGHAAAHRLRRPLRGRPPVRDRRRRAGAHRRRSSATRCASGSTATPLAARGLTVSRRRGRARRARTSSCRPGRIESDRRATSRCASQRSYREAGGLRAACPLAKGDDGYVVRLGDVAPVELRLGRAPRLLPQQRRAEHRPRHRQDLDREQPRRRARRARRGRARSSRRLPEGTRIFVAFDTHDLHRRRGRARATRRSSRRSSWCWS